VLAALIVVAAAAGWWLTRSARRDATPPIATTPSAPMTALPAPAQKPLPKAARPAAANAKPAAPDAKPASAPAKNEPAPRAVVEKAFGVTKPAPTKAAPADAMKTPAATAAPRKLGDPLPKADLTPPKVDATAAKTQAPKPATAPVRPAPAATAATAATATALPTIWDLPYSTRKDIPAIELSMHVYSSDPKQRFVVIKGERRVEGDDVSDDLVLREIRQDGIVLEFKGQKFFYPSTGR
jgi:general secretion pathway protein B